jgi:hypothetical protein
MKTGQFLGLLFLVGLLISAHIFLYIQGNVIGYRSVGHILGGAVTLLILPTLIVVPWRFFKRKNSVAVNAPLFVAAVAYIVLAVLWGRGVSVQQADRDSLKFQAVKPSKFAYSPPACNYTVTFPAPPEFTEIVFEGRSPFQQANLYQKDSFMRAECAPADENQFVSKNEKLDHLREFASKNGLKDIEISIDKRTDHFYGTGRGVKKVNGKWVIYKFRLGINKGSAMAVVVAGLANGFPQVGLFTFINSMTPVQALQVTTGSNLSGYLAGVSKQLNQRLPYMIDKWTEWTTTVSGSNSLEYRYRILNWSSNPTPGLLVKQRLILETLCRDKFIVSVMNKGGIIKRSYYNDKSKYLGGFEITQRDCFEKD